MESVYLCIFSLCIFLKQEVPYYRHVPLFMRVLWNFYLHPLYLHFLHRSARGILMWSMTGWTCVWVVKEGDKREGSWKLSWWTLLLGSLRVWQVNLQGDWAEALTFFPLAALAAAAKILKALCNLYRLYEPAPYWMKHLTAVFNADCPHVASVAAGWGHWEQLARVASLSSSNGKFK